MTRFQAAGANEGKMFAYHWGIYFFRQAGQFIQSLFTGRLSAAQRKRNTMRYDAKAAPKQSIDSWWNNDSRIEILSEDFNETQVLAALNEPS
jgi:hypothetical protein